MKSYYLQSDIDEICNALKKYKKKFNNKNILITGGNGFLGKYFQAVFHQFGSNITVLDRSAPELQFNNINYCRVDITNTKEFLTVLPENIKFDYILAAASIASPKLYKNFPIETMNVGFNGLKNCLDLAINNKSKLLYFSSSEVYQTANIIPTPETYVGAIPSDGERSCYDISKLIGECLVYSYVKKHNINAKIVLPFNFYGPQAMDGRVLPSFMNNIINNKSLEIYDTGEHTRCYTYITDGIIGCILALVDGKVGEKYNIGNPNNEISVYNLAKKVNSICNKNKLRLTKYHSDYAGGSNPTRRVPDITKAKNELKFNPEISLDDGIKRFHNWAHENYKD